MLESIETPRSSNIRRVEYDGHNLYITFKTQGRYEYSGVPSNLFEEAQIISERGSIGRWFLYRVKNNYPSKRVE